MSTRRQGHWRGRLAGHGKRQQSGGPRAHSFRNHRVDLKDANQAGRQAGKDDLREKIPNRHGRSFSSGNQRIGTRRLAVYAARGLSYRDAVEALRRRGIGK